MHTTTIYVQDEPLIVAGAQLNVGDSVKNIPLTDKDLTDRMINEIAPAKKILNIFPSVDTAVCAMSVRKFNEEASKLPNVTVLCISADLPFAQARFCGAEGLDNVKMLSTFRHPESKLALGVDIIRGKLTGLTARCVLVLNEHGKVLYSELLSQITHEPNYSAAIAALK